MDQEIRYFFRVMFTDRYASQRETCPERGQSCMNATTKKIHAEKTEAWTSYDFCSIIELHRDVKVSRHAVRVFQLSDDEENRNCSIDSSFPAEQSFIPIVLFQSFTIFRSPQWLAA